LSFRSRRRSCAIARGGSFAPTRSARTPPVARTLGRQRENAAVRRRVAATSRRSRAAPPKWSRRTTRLREAVPPGSAASHSPLAARPLARSCSRMRGPPHGLFREEEADPLHPRCLPSRGCPFRCGREASRSRGRTGAPQVVPNLWIPGPGAFSFRAAPAILDGMTRYVDSTFLTMPFEGRRVSGVGPKPGAGASCSRRT